VLRGIKTKTIVICLTEILESRENLNLLTSLLQLQNGVILTPSANITMMIMIGDNSVDSSNEAYWIKK